MRVLLAIVLATVGVYVLAQALSPGRINAPLWMAFEGMVLASVLSAAVLVTLAFRARRRAPRPGPERPCPNCGYDLKDLPAQRCPECGQA